MKAQWEEVLKKKKKLFCKYVPFIGIKNMNDMKRSTTPIIKKTLVYNSLHFK
jgi:hypothetical protein